MGFGGVVEVTRKTFYQRGHRGRQNPTSGKGGQKWGTQGIYPRDLKDEELIVWNDLQLVEQFGGILDSTAKGEAIRDLLIRSWSKIRVKKGGVHYFKLNRTQREYARQCSQRNIVLKARQMGMTTYVAARFFIQTITRPGTLTVQVAHSQESAEEIFKIVRRFWENLPKGMQCGALATSRANIRQLVFPRLDSEYRVATAADPNAGRGMTIHHLHCSEVARWPRDGADTLASLRAAVPEDGEIVLESTPNGAGGVFYEEWQRADETGYTRHFFPWWYERSYRIGTALPQRAQRNTEGRDAAIAVESRKKNRICRDVLD